jgi:predicted phosphodiesterase
MKIRFIGDVHGKWNTYKKRIKDVETSIQVGDFGVGFFTPYTDKLVGGNPPYDHMSRGNHRFIRGNHDNPEFCRKHPYWIPDGTIVHDKIFCVGGAYSIDRHHRVEGYDWWPDEELSYVEFNQLLSVYKEQKPEVIVAHEIPESICTVVTEKMNMTKLDIPSITRQFLDILIEEHKPSLFVHGHWHINHHTVCNGVEYIGLGELNFVDLDV